MSVLPTDEHNDDIEAVIKEEKQRLKKKFEKKLGDMENKLKAEFYEDLKQKESKWKSKKKALMKEIDQLSKKLENPSGFNSYGGQIPSLEQDIKNMDL